MVHPLQQIIDSCELIISKAQETETVLNKDADLHNEMCDALEIQEKSIENLKESLEFRDGTIAKQTTVIEVAAQRILAFEATINTLNAELRELRALDPKRIKKINTKYKQDIAKLKESNKNLDAARRAAIGKANAKKAANFEPFHIDPTSRNTLRVIPGIRVGSECLGGVHKSPVIEFFHESRGVTRRGYLGNREGNLEMFWASAQNSMPTTEEDMIAKDYVMTYCKAAKIKL